MMVRNFCREYIWLVGDSLHQRDYRVALIRLIHLDPDDHRALHCYLSHLHFLFRLYHMLIFVFVLLMRYQLFEVFSYEKRKQLTH